MKVVRSRRVLVAAFLALALPLTLAACGSEDGDSTDTAAQEEETPQEEATEGETSTEAQEVHVVAKEYTFEGIPSTLEAGSYSFHFENAGKEEHELAMARIKTDVAVDELLKMPEKEQMKQIEVVGGTFAKPGETAKQPLEAELEAGRYVAVCFVPNKKGPHAFQGMVHEFSVE